VTGSPLLRAVIALALLLLLAWPLRWFTTPRSQSAAPVASATPSPMQKVHLELVSTRAPFTYAVENLGKIVWQGTSRESTTVGDLDIAFPPEGIDLVLKKYEDSLPGQRTLEAATVKDATRSAKK